MVCENEGLGRHFAVCWECFVGMKMDYILPRTYMYMYVHIQLCIGVSELAFPPDSWSYDRSPRGRVVLGACRGGGHVLGSRVRGDNF